MSLYHLEPSGPVQGCNGIALPFTVSLDNSVGYLITLAVCTPIHVLLATIIQVTVLF
jgi:hypothetical protein